jgi:gamma-glutamyl-gamma-aminobutyraldehyde dehydrogenase
MSIAAFKLAPALAAGNSVILKPASPSPLSALKLAELAAEAGIPAGVFSVLTGPASQVGEPLSVHPDVDCLAFTGSPEVGRRLLRAAADSNLKDVWLELGGKSPNLVFADVEDLDTAAQWAAGGIFFNQGEVCSAVSRLLVERSIKDEFVAKVVAAAEAVRPGDPLDPASTMGAIVNDGHVREVLGHIDRAQEQGAELRHGGSRVTVEGSDCFLEPTVFDEVAIGSDLAQKEVFGPVLAVTAFDTEEEAIALANGTEYGLAASLWTSSLSRTHRVSPRLNAGTVSVNTVDAMSPMTPFGGVKTSGNGRDLSLHALEKFTALKTTWIKY